MATAVRKTNWFAIWVSVAVVAILVIVAGIVIAMNNRAAGPGAEPSGSIIDTQNGAVTFGKGPNTVETYIDFMCPYCNQFEQSEGADIQQLIKADKVTLKVHPVTILNNSSNPAGYSSRAAGAFYAVAGADPANAYAYLQALYANQPQEGSAGLTDQKLVDIAKSAGVNVTPDLEKAITSNKYQKFALSHGLPSGATGTPTVVVNGTMIPVTMNFQQDIVPHLTK